MIGFVYLILTPKLLIFYLLSRFSINNITQLFRRCFNRISRKFRNIVALHTTEVVFRIVLRKHKSLMVMTLWVKV